MSQHPPHAHQHAAHPPAVHPPADHPPASHDAGLPLPGHEPKQISSELEREFELERMVLFSDAVFAIAITLLVIDIKWPDLPKDLSHTNIVKFFVPTFFQFFAFTLSFFFIGQSWSNHLRLFRLLRKYDQGLIKRNLFFLFFIVIFPFAAAGMSGHVRTGFLYPIYVYFTNLSLVSITNVSICRYIFYKKPALSVPGQEAEKKYIYIKNLYTSYSLAAATIVLVVVGSTVQGNDGVIAYGCSGIAIVLAIANRKAKKFKPATPDPAARPAPASHPTNLPI
jgi:uncharacterized membrane protein